MYFVSDILLRFGLINASQAVLVAKELPQTINRGVVHIHSYVLQIFILLLFVKIIPFIFRNLTTPLEIPDCDPMGLGVVVVFNARCVYYNSLFGQINKKCFLFRQTGLIQHVEV